MGIIVPHMCNYVPAKCLPLYRGYRPDKRNTARRLKNRKPGLGREEMPLSIDMRLIGRGTQPLAIQQRTRLPVRVPCLNPGLRSQSSFAETVGYLAGVRLLRCFET